jgi:hypothetical protein
VTFFWQLWYNSVCHSCDVVLTIIIQFSLSLLWHCSDNYNTIRFCHSCDVFLTIIIQFSLSLLWHCSDNYNTIRFYHSSDVFLTIIIQFSLSLSWRCSDNYNTIRFYHSRDVVLTIIIQFSLSLLWRCSDNYNTILFVTLVTLVWQLPHNSFGHSCDVVQAQQVLYSVDRKVRNLCIPVDLQLKFFDNIVLPIRIYSCKVWGFENCAEIEKVHLRFCQKILNVRQTTSNWICNTSVWIWDSSVGNASGMCSS